MSTSHTRESGRPTTNITAEDIFPGLKFVSYIPGEPGSALHGRFLSLPEWVDDETTCQVRVVIDGEQGTMDLYTLGIGNSRYGDAPVRACIPDDTEEDNPE